MLQEEAAEQRLDRLAPDLNKVHAAAKHLLALINDVLDLAKIESGKLELHLETFDVAGMIQEVVTTIQPLAERNANELQVHCPADIGSLHADSTKVRQGLFNLLSNACKFTERGVVSVRVSREQVGNVDWVVFAVADSGIGIVNDQMDRLFERFGQGLPATARKYGGTGLGLAITRRFCQLMGGEINVASEPGKGSTFTIRLPAVVSDTRPVEQKADELGRSVETSSRRT